MKATGIVRRIDDLGRVVIPKEIRRTMRIREGDPLEIYTDREGEVIFKKYSPIGELSAFAGQYAETLYKTCGLSVAICDRDAVIACAGVPRREYADKPLSEAAESIMEARSFYTAHTTTSTAQTRPSTLSSASQSPSDPPAIPLIRDGGSLSISCAMPILSEGDIVGCVVSLIPDKDTPADHPTPDVEAKLIQTAANFLGRQLEG